MTAARGTSRSHGITRNSRQLAVPMIVAQVALTLVEILR